MPYAILNFSTIPLALILEEVAIDTGDEAEEKRLLNCAEELHIDSLRLARFLYFYTIDIVVGRISFGEVKFVFVGKLVTNIGLQLVLCNL